MTKLLFAATMLLAICQAQNYNAVVLDAIFWGGLQNAVIDNSGDTGVCTNQNMTSCFSTNGINLQNIMNNFYYSYTNIQYGLANANINSLYTGLNDLGSAWDELFGMASVCYPSCANQLNYAGLCGMELIQLNSDISF